jgi:N-dimethylarginine dimethylaminohydrolase
MYHNRSLWDRLRVCVVGRSWPPEFYDWIVDLEIRSAMERIALETEEDYQELIKCLHSFDISVVRPIINPDAPTQHIAKFRPPMCPGDDLIMLGDTLIKSFTPDGQQSSYYDNIVEHVLQQGNTVKTTQLQSINGASVYQLGKQILFTTNRPTDSVADLKNFIKNISKVSKVNCMHQCDHIDGWFVPVTPGLIIAGTDSARPELMSLFFDTYFPGWEVIELPPTLSESHMFENWQRQHHGNWWVPGQEHNRKFTEFVDRYLTNWVGNVQETIFDLNMIVVDQHNVIVSHYNQQVFDAFARHKVTPHLVRLRHANFWDGGIHCVTTELHREN